MMKTYSDISHVIALSCHVDYFDVKEGTLSRPICSSRLKSYEAFLKGMPKYTPQMIINGRYDAVGYLPDKIEIAFDHAYNYPVKPVVIEHVGFEFEWPVYYVLLPEIRKGRYQLWLIAYDFPRSLTVRGGANLGKNMTYYNTVSKAKFLGSWNGESKNITIDEKLPEETKGFAFIVQDV